MTEELNKSSETVTDDTHGKQNVAVSREEKFKELKDRIARADKEAEIRKSERERLLREGETAREKNLDDAISKMAENTARAQEAASERIARLEYRQSVIERARRNRRTYEKAEKDEKLLAEKREKELLDFVEREKEEAEARETANAALLDKISAVTEETVSEQTEPPVAQEPSVCEETEAVAQMPESENGEEILIQNGAGNTETAETEETDGKEFDGDRIVLNINPSEKITVTQGDENVIHIGARQVDATGTVLGAAALYGAVKTASGIEARILEAQRRHIALKNAAIENAHGIFEEEARLLEEEEQRYNSEIAELRAKRFELAEQRDYTSESVYYPEAEPTVDEYEKAEDVLRFGASFDEISIGEEYDRTKRAELDFLKAAETYGIGENFEYSLGTEEYSYPDADKAEVEAKAVEDYERGLEKEELFAGSEDSDFASVEAGLYNFRAEEDLSLFDRTQLRNQLNAYHREEKSLLKKYARTEKKQKRASQEENTVLIVEKIGIQKEITELAIEALAACVYVGARSKTSKYKNHLIKHVDRYNAICDEYEIHTGKPLTRISPDIANEIVGGRICQPIPNVYLAGEDRPAVYDERLLENREMYRFAEEYGEEAVKFDKFGDTVPPELSRAQRREKEKKHAERMSAVKRATERDVLLIGLRNDYRVAGLEAERDILVNSFGNKDKQREKKIRLLDRKIDKIRHGTRRALKLEREDNARYYLLTALDGKDEKVKKGARQERLDALKMRLDVLISERERINESLISLYGGDDKKLKAAKVVRKAGNVRKRYAKYMYKKQKRLASKINSMKAPLDIKEKAYSVLNKKTVAVAKVEECRYKLKRLKPKGRAKRELVSDMKRAKSSLKILDADLRFLMKKLRRHHERYIDDRNWGIVLIVCALVLAAGIAVWYFFGRNVNFAEFFANFGKK